MYFPIQNRKWIRSDKLLFAKEFHMETVQGVTVFMDGHTEIIFWTKNSFERKNSQLVKKISFDIIPENGLCC